MGCELSTPETVGDKRSGNSLPNSNRNQRKRKSNVNVKEPSIYDSMVSSTYENSMDCRNDIATSSPVVGSRGRGDSGINYPITLSSDINSGIEGIEYGGNATAAAVGLDAPLSVGVRPARISELSSQEAPKNCSAEALLGIPYFTSERTQQNNLPLENRNSAILMNYCISPSSSSTATLNHTTRPRLTAASLGALDASLTSIGKSVSLGWSNHSPPVTTSIPCPQCARPSHKRPHEVAVSQQQQQQAQLKAPALETVVERQVEVPEVPLSKPQNPSPLNESLKMSTATLFTSSPALVDSKVPLAAYQDPAASVTSTSMSPSLLASSVCSPSSRRLPFAQNTRVRGPKRPINVPTDDELRQVPSFQAALRQAIEFNSSTKEDFTPLTLEGLGVTMPTMDHTNFGNYNSASPHRNRSVSGGAIDELCF